MIKILFEDDLLIVCIKPVGVLSQSDSKGGESMITLLEEYTGNTIYPLHRLDREVGGVMVYAKTKFSASVLSRDIAENRFKKEYIAIVHGSPLEREGVLQDLLFKDSSKNKSYVVKKERKGVKKASLEYKTIATNNDLTAVKILLHTGRTHQIRVQFASRKMPLVGDKKYGAKDNFRNIGLMSYRLTFKHPKNEEIICISHGYDEFIDKYI
jgi:23S rRNA pseudouridine1911/1915/1917 synthase